MTSMKRGRPFRPKDAKPPFSDAFWTRVEKLRKFLHLTQSDMAHLYGVSRLTYYKWVTAKAWPQGDNITTVQHVTGKLAALVTARRWPTPDAMALTPGQRLDRLVAVVGRRA
jgi:DNA-binding XRE family transcriptional regulator